MHCNQSSKIILNTHQTGIQSPLCYITRICFPVPSPIAAVHHYVSKACWVDVRCWFRFFWGTTIIAYYWVKVITRGYKHVFRLPAFFWYNVELNLQSKNRLISTAAFVCRRKRPGRRAFPRFGHPHSQNPSDMGIRPVTLTLTQIPKVIREGDAHIAMVLGMGMPISL